MGRWCWVWIAAACVTACADDDAVATDASVTVDRPAPGRDPIPILGDEPIIDDPVNTRIGRIEIIEASASQLASTGGLVEIEFQDLPPVVLPSYETPALSVAAASFSDNDVGLLAEVSGASDPDNNGRFPLLSVLDSGLAVIGNPDLGPGSASGANIEITGGHGPIGADIDLLTQSAEVTIEKSAGSETDASSMRVLAGGAGYRLDSAGTPVHGVPLDGSAVTLQCTTGDGDCGIATGVVVTLETTNADTAGLPVGAMPIGTRAARLDCRFFAGDATIPAAAMRALLGADDADVTRVQTLIRRVNFARAGNSDGTNEHVAVVGHGLIGWTDR